MQRLLIDRQREVERWSNRRARESFQQYRIPFTVCLNAFLRSAIDFSQTTSNGDKIRPSIPAVPVEPLVDEITWPLHRVSVLLFFGGSWPP